MKKRIILIKVEIPKLKIFEEQFETDQYKVCISQCKRSLLAQFRMGFLSLAIEKGSFKSIHVEERVCSV